MFFSLLPDARHLAMSEFLRGRAAAKRRATPGQAPLPVYRPAASRFLLAGLCAWILWQPLKGTEAAAPAPVATQLICSTSSATDAAPASPVHR